MAKKEDAPVIIEQTPEEPKVTAEPVAPVSTGVSEDTRTIVTVLTLIFFTPIGVILMWVWTKWKTWVKGLVTCIACCPLIILAVVLMLSSILVALFPSDLLDNNVIDTEIDTDFDYDQYPGMEEYYEDEYYLPEEDLPTTEEGIPEGDVQNTPQLDGVTY